MKTQKLAAQLADWERQGLITPEQSGGIQAYEESRSTTPWVLYSFIMLGVTVVAVGIISLVAANWADIPPWAKLGADFTLLCALAACLCRYGDSGKPAVFDALAAFFILLCLASIGLIAQIYQAGGELYQALLLWCGITLPITLFAFKKYIPHLWVTALLTAVVLYCFRDTHFYEAGGIYPLALFWSLPLSVFLAGALCRSLQPTANLSGAFFFWAAVLLMAATVYFDLVHSAGLILDSPVHPARLFDTRSGVRPVQPLEKVLYQAVDLLSAAAIALVIFMKGLDKKARLFLCLLAVLFCLMMNSYGIIDYAAYQGRYFSPYAKSSSLALKLIGPGACIAMLLCLSFLFSGLQRLRLFSLCLNLMGVRFLIVYFQVFGTLATTGLGLIVSGLVIIGAVVLWYKTHKKLAAWFGGLPG